MTKIGYKPVILLFAVLLLLMNLSVAARPGPAQADDSCQTFAETGFKVCGRFLDYWKNNGGLTQQGLPISDVFDEQNAPPPAGDGKLHRVQYFQRARFEQHLENGPPYDVLLGLLGTEQFKTKYGQVAAPAPQPEPCQYFKETDLKVCGRFLQYWLANGGLTQQGLPISGVINEQNAPPPAGDGKPHKVQYFQRARFEQHLENATPYDVLLGLLGTEQYRVKTSQPVGPTTPVAPTTPLIPNPIGPLPPGSPQPAPTPTPPLPVANGPVQPYGCLPGFINIDDIVQACVNNPTQARNTDVTVYGRLILSGRVIPNTQMITSWKYPDHIDTCKAAAGDSGIASCSLSSGGSASGTSVVITVYFVLNSQIYNGSTTFTLQ